jgi:hypothetical protein
MTDEPATDELLHFNGINGWTGDGKTARKRGQRKRGQTRRYPQNNVQLNSILGRDSARSQGSERRWRTRGRRC